MGIAPGDAARIFEPFFTTRREQGGTGLGLPIAKALLGNAGGTIDYLPPSPIRNRDSRHAGARFRIRFRTSVAEVLVDLAFKGFAAPKPFEVPYESVQIALLCGTGWHPPYGES